MHTFQVGLRLMLRNRYEWSKPLLTCGSRTTETKEVPSILQTSLEHEPAQSHFEYKYFLSCTIACGRFHKVPLCYTENLPQTFCLFWICHLIAEKLFLRWPFPSSHAFTDIYLISPFCLLLSRYLSGWRIIVYVAVLWIEITLNISSHLLPFFFFSKFWFILFELRITEVHW